MREKRLLRPWQGIIMIILAAVEVFIVSGYLSGMFGLYGAAINELILLALGVGTTVISGADLKAVFQFRKPKMTEVFGTLVLWLGCYLFTLMITMVVTLFFPEEMTEVGTGLSQMFTSVSFFVSIFIVSLMPAVCEEVLFRGAFFNSIWNGLHKKWPVILIVSVVFGVFHGSIWRFIPTCILGIAMGYLMFETNNMFCNMIFHAVNNAVPLILLYGMQAVLRMTGMEQMMNEAQSSAAGISLAVVGVDIMWGAVGVFLIYIGNYLLHARKPGYTKEIFSLKK